MVPKNEKTFVNRKVKRILSFAKNIKVAGFRNMVPNGGTVTFHLLTRFVDSQVIFSGESLCISSKSASRPVCIFAGKL